MMKFFYNKKLADYGLQKYKLKNGDTTNTVLYIGIYLYKALDEDALYNLLQNLFTAEKEIYTVYEGIAANLFDWVVNNYDYESEITLKSVTDKLAKNDFPYRLGYLLQNKGNILKNTGKMRWALEFFEKDLKIMEELVALEPGRTDFRRDLSVSFSFVGQIYKAMGEGQKALAFFEKSLKVREELVALEPGRTDFRKDLSVSFSFVGQIYQDMGEGQKALAFFEKQKTTLEELVALEPGKTNFRRDLSVSFSNVGQIYQAMGEGQKALAFFEKFLIIMEELVALEPGRMDFRKDFSASFSFVGQIYHAMGEEQKALAFFEKSLKVMEELVALEPGRTDFRRYLSMSFSNVGQIYKTMGEGQKALAFLEKGLKISEELVALEPGRTDFRNDLSTTFSFVGQIYQAMGEGQKALAFFEKSLKVREELVAIEPGRMDFRIDYAISHFNMFIACNDTDKLYWLTKTKEIAEPMVKSGVTHVQIKQLWNYVLQEFSLYSSSGNPTEVSKVNVNKEKRSQALTLYQSGNYKQSKQLLEELLHDNFEVLSTRMHLARLALISDNAEEAANQTHEVWKTCKEAKNYVLARILWFKLCIEYINSSNKQNTDFLSKLFSVQKKENASGVAVILGQLKFVLQQEDAFMEWTMQPVLDHIKPRLTEQQHALLTALVAAMSYMTNMDKLNEFEEWRDAKPEEIEK